MKTSTNWTWPIIAGLFAALLALSLQWTNGFYSSDLGADPDESAHAVTSLMVRDYLTEGLGSNPVAFAKSYYERYPKVALGHYPPLYYAVGSLWLLPVRSVSALGVSQTVQVGLLVGIAAWLLALRLPPIASTLLALGWSALPFLQKNTILVMSDLQVSLLCLCAALAFWQFLEKGTLRWSLAFGFLAAATILTKGSGWLLALVPGISIALSGDWRKLWNWRLWMAVLPVALLALPWQLWSTAITARGMSNLTPGEHLQLALPFYAEAMPRSLGWLALAVLTCSLAVRLTRLTMGKTLDKSLAVLWSLILSTCILISLVPSGLSSRYLLPLYFPVLVVGVWELTAFVRWVAQSHAGERRWLQCAAAALLVVTGAIGQSPYFRKKVEGYASAFQAVKNISADDSDLHVLIVSDARGEGAVVAAAAFNPVQTKPQSQRVEILRASKELADQDWLGRGLSLKAKSPTEIRDLLDKLAVDWVLVDKSVSRDSLTAYHHLIDECLSQPVAGWRVSSHRTIQRSPSQQGEIVLYQRQHSL